MHLFVPNFHEYIKYVKEFHNRYTSDELKYLPVGTVIFTPPTPAPLLYEEWKQQQAINAANPNNSQQSSKLAETGTKVLIKIERLI